MIPDCKKSHQILSSVYIAHNDILKKQGMHSTIEPNKVAKLGSKIISKPMTSVCFMTEQYQNNQLARYQHCTLFGLRMHF